jgi:hypothetical protein
VFWTTFIGQAVPRRVEGWFERIFSFVNVRATGVFGHLFQQQFVFFAQCLVFLAQHFQLVL